MKISLNRIILAGFIACAFVLAMLMHSQPAYAKRMLEPGAHGYVTKDSPADEIFAAIDEAMKRQCYVCREICEHNAGNG